MNQELLLNLIINYESCRIQAFEELSLEDFTLPCLKIWEVICDLDIENDRISEITVKNKMGTVSSLVIKKYKEIINLNVVQEDIKSIIKSIKLDAITKRTRRYADALVKAADKQDINEIKELSVESESIIIGEERSSELITSDISLADVFEHGYKGYKGSPSYISALDNHIGSLGNGELIIVAGQPSNGKSLLARHISIQAALNDEIPTIVFSTDETHRQYFIKVLCNLTGISINQLKNHSLNSREVKELEKVKSKVLDGVIKNNIFFYKSEGIGLRIHEIVTKTKRIKRLRGKTPFVVVDYIQKMAKEQNDAEIAKVIFKLSDICKYLEVPLIAVSQFNRAIDTRQDGTPLLSDLRGSGAIEQAADKAIFIIPEQQARTNRPNPFKCSYYIMKDREGAPGVVEVMINGATQRIEPITGF